MGTQPESGGYDENIMAFFASLNEQAFTSKDLIPGLRADAELMSAGVVQRFLELDAAPDGLTVHAIELADGPLRVAITSPPGGKYVGSPAWRVIVNRGRTTFQGAHNVPREFWQLSDFVVQPDDLRFGCVHNAATYSIGYGEAAPPEGMPPRIIRDVYTGVYSISRAEGHKIATEGVPLLSREKRITFYRKYIQGVGGILDVLRYMSASTEVDTAPDLRRDGDN